MLNTSINSGVFKGRILGLPPQELTRAVSQKVRMAIFNKLEVSGKTVLDLFAGGGTLGFEALSMGADNVTFVDQAYQAVKMIDANSRSLDVRSRVRIVKSDAGRFLSKNKFDIVFMDPPYAKFDVALVKRVSNLLQLGGILVVSCSSKTTFDISSQYELLDQKNYGDTKIMYLRKNKYLKTIRQSKNY